MSPKILYQQHIMWYESNMIWETLDSLQSAIQHSTIPVHVKICLNSQILLEQPINGTAMEMFDVFLNHPVLRNAEIIHKTDNDLFYNIGDWRRDEYSSEYKYTVWGESDCLVPEDYFYILSTLDIRDPHILSCASRIMWDDSWTIVEHELLQQYPNLDNQKSSHPELTPYRYYDHITINEINDFNSQSDIIIKQLPYCKVDGSLLALSKNLPTPFIAPDLHFVREDTCAALFFKKHQIPQYHISTRIKGHNYYHPLKRMNTTSSRSDNSYTELAALSDSIITNFIHGA